MLQYIESSIESNITNRDLEHINYLVENVRHDEEVGVSYMKSWEYEQMWLEEDMEKGELSHLISLICKKLQRNYSIEEIADILEEPFDKVQKLCEIASEYAPEYDIEAIWQKYNETKETRE